MGTEISLQGQNNLACELVAAGIITAKQAGEMLSTQPAQAAPAPVERRAGQRWRVTYEKRRHYQIPPAVIELTDRRKEGWGCRNIENASFPGWINDTHWMDGNDQGATMTLVSDAPATSEPGRAEMMIDSKITGTGAQYNPGPAAGDAPAPAIPARPAKGAAKAEPKCVGAKSFPCFGPRALRHTVKGKPPFLLCEGHYLHAEASLVPGYDTHKTSIDSMSERLPRPRLAHSMGVEDPALPEAR